MVKFPRIDRLHKRFKTDYTLFQRAINSSKWVGAHVSAAGGPANAIINATLIGATSFGLFLSSQRKWDGKQFDDEQVKEFKDKLQEFGYNHILPHGSYLVNLGNPSHEIRKKSYDAFLQDLKRCETLGIKLYNFHPGSCLKNGDREQSLQYIAQALNDAHAETRNVITVLENSAGQGFSVGTTFEELRAIIDGVKEKSRVGVCLDTCHLFAAGYVTCIVLN
jgi:AP endonuclease-1